MTIPWLRLSARVAHFLGVTLPEGTDFEVGVEAWGRGEPWRQEGVKQKSSETGSLPYLKRGTNPEGASCRFSFFTTLSTKSGPDHGRISRG